MNNPKRLLAILFAACLAVACAGCTSGGSASSSGDSPSASAEASSSASQGAGLADGVYEIEIETDSSMVNVVAGLLSVEDGSYTATMSLNGEGFSRLYLGKADDAQQAPDADVYDYHLNDEGKYTFDFPIPALDEDVDVALFGQRRDTWYDHVLVFHAPTGDALSDAAASAGASSSSALAGSVEEGEHTIEVTLSGGSGKASVESPAKLVVSGDDMVATIVWSSPNYDQMVVDGVQYLPINEEGNSTFEIPVTALDEDMSVSAETTAMSEPHMIDYVLYFDSSTLK